MLEKLSNRTLNYAGSSIDTGTKINDKASI